ncbi:MAG: helix-turn-helix transcriptional regulator [Caloramator sp.]|nr:helix-turn-helix transcriptional regulator [Caloramator sp.]
MINLKQLRLQQGLSQRKLANKANISQSMLSDIENNKVNPTIITLQKLAKALDIDIGELIQVS